MRTHGNTHGIVILCNMEWLCRLTAWVCGICYSLLRTNRAHMCAVRPHAIHTLSHSLTLCVPPFHAHLHKHINLVQAGPHIQHTAHSNTSNAHLQAHIYNSTITTSCQHKPLAQATHTLLAALTAPLLFQ